MAQSWVQKKVEGRHLIRNKVTTIFSDKKYSKGLCTVHLHQQCLNFACHFNAQCLMHELKTVYLAQILLFLDIVDILLSSHLDLWKSWICMTWSFLAIIELYVILFRQINYEILQVATPETKRSVLSNAFQTRVSDLIDWRTTFVTLHAEWSLSSFPQIHIAMTNWVHHSQVTSKLR